MVLDALRLILFPILMIYAAISDTMTMTISNRVSLIVGVGFVVMAAFTGMSMSAFLWHIVAGIVVLAIAFGMFARGWIGGGDAKLAAATALWFGFDALLPYAVYASLLGGVLTFLFIQMRIWPLPQVLQSQGWLARLWQKQVGIPYGIALAAAALIVYPMTPWMRAIDPARPVLR